MPNLSDISQNAKRIKKQIAEQAGVAPTDVNDDNLSEAGKILEGAKAADEAGVDPLQVHPSELKQQATGEVDVSKPADLSKQQKIAMAITAIAPTLLGYAFGGAEGGAIGAQTSQNVLKDLGSQEREKEKSARELAAKKELQREQLAARAEDREADRNMRKDIADEANRTRREIADLKNGKGGVKLTKGQEAVDKNFAKEYDTFVLGGGYADVQKSLKQLTEVGDQLGKTDSATGPLVGRLPKWARNIATPEGSAIQDQVEEVVQRNLRLVLGPQFTEREGKQLIERAYNTNLSEAENQKRVARLAQSIQQAADAKLAASEYYEENGTLQGYKGTTRITLDDIARTAGLDGDEKGGPVEGLENPMMPKAAAAGAGALRNKPLEEMSEAELQAHIKKLKGK